MLLGAAWGVLYDITVLFEKAISHKPFTFLCDVIMMIIYALSFFSFLIGYNGGEIRVLLLILSLAGFLLYLLTMHRFIKRLFDKLSRSIKRRSKNLAKYLKKIKKC